MKALLAGGFAFVVFSALPGAALAIGLYASRRHSVADAKGDLLLALYFVGVTTALTAAGFLLPTAVDRRWRSLPWRRAALIAGGLGLLAPVARLAAAAASRGSLLALFRTAPMAAMAVLEVVPGVVLGVAALLVVRALRPAARALP